MKLPVVFQDVGLICGNRLWLWGELTFGNEDEMGKRNGRRLAAKGKPMI